MSLSRAFTAFCTTASTVASSLLLASARGPRDDVAPAAASVGANA